MDQFVLVYGRKNKAVFIDCQSLVYRYVPMPEGVVLVVFDTGMQRKLARSAYNRREAECEDAVRQISSQLSRNTSVSSLREVSVEEFESVRKMLPTIAQKRTRHVISENERVLKSVEMLEKQDVRGFGKLMFESQWSLRDNYEVSCHELDVFVEIAAESEGVLGARMTGAGFGGSAVALVENDALDDFIKRVRMDYPKKQAIR